MRTGVSFMISSKRSFIINVLVCYIISQILDLPYGIYIFKKSTLVGTVDCIYKRTFIFKLDCIYAAKYLSY